MAGKNLFRFDSNKRQKKILKYSLIFMVALFLGALIYSTIEMIINHDKTATIEILIAPSDAKVEIDGRTFPTKSTIKIRPGTYAVKIEKDGFISFNGSIKANADETSYLYEFLNEENENGTYYKDNEQDSLRAQQISDKKADLFHENYNGTDQIWNITPYDDYASGYKIWAEKGSNESNLPSVSGNTNSDKITINIYLYTCSDDRLAKLKQSALDYLEEKKIKIENYTIKYSNCS